MLRAARFAATLEFAPTRRVVGAMREMAERLDIVSAERIRDELSRLLTAPSGQSSPVDTSWDNEARGVLSAARRSRRLVAPTSPQTPRTSWKHYFLDQMSVDPPKGLSTAGTMLSTSPPKSVTSTLY